MSTFNLREQIASNANIKGTGDGTTGDPFIPEHSITPFIADETNIFMGFLENGGSKQQAVDGSTTPVIFSTPTIPAGKALVIARLIIYMEDDTNFLSTLFGGLPALTNGWEIKGNGVTFGLAKDNMTLASYMFDLTGDKIFGKDNQTLVGRFSLNKFINGASGFTIRSGEVMSTIVNDDLTGLDFLNVMAEGHYIDV